MTTHYRLMIKATAIIINALLPFALLAQDTSGKSSSGFVYNQPTENNSQATVGIVNIPEGNQTGFQLGLTNTNQKDFSGTQIALTNSIGGTGKGAQIGLVNSNKLTYSGTQVGWVNITGSHIKGAQVGYVNLSTGKVTGAQCAFVNIAKDSVKGVQAGYVNVAGSATQGAQLGFVNVSKGSVKGSQVGFVNVTGATTQGSQIGYVNLTRNVVNGSQFGFINIADSVKKGVPVGFLSIVRHGGFKVIEVAGSEMFPATLSLKFGVRRFYTSFSASYNPNHKQDFALGVGIGTVVSLSKSFYFNPELTNQSTIERKPLRMVTLSTVLGYQISKNWSVVAGPQLTWSNKNRNSESNFEKPDFNFYQHKIDDRNQLHAGGKVALRFHFN